MSDLLTEQHTNVLIITLNRVDKQNAFDDALLNSLQLILDEAINNPLVRVIILKSNGKHFSAGADLHWMQRMANFSEEENLNDAMGLAYLMRTLHECPKPVIAVVQGAAFGGGAGLAAACDIVIAATTARFCFSEVKLGLIPAVISPYVVKAIGERAAKWLFMSAEIIDAPTAKQLNLVHYCLEEDKLWSFAFDYAHQIASLAPEAVIACKSLVNTVANQPITDDLVAKTASLIAKKRVSPEGQQGLQAFLNKTIPSWN